MPAELGLVLPPNSSQALLARTKHKATSDSNLCRGYDGR